MPKKNNRKDASASVDEPAFVIDDAGSLVNPRLPLIARRIIEFLDGYPFGKLLSTRGLAAAVGYTSASMRHNTCDTALQDYRQIMKRENGRSLFGSKPTILALRKKLAREDAMAGS